jgi:CheY-like chemotaxis protein
MRVQSKLTRVEDCKRVRVIPQTPNPEPARAAPLRILVAEDDPCDALLLEQALFSVGVNAPAHFVDDEEEAIEYLRGDPPFGNRAAHPLPTLLLLDLSMSRLNGFAALKWLGRQPGLSRILIVAFGSSADCEAIHHAYALGADSCVLKPRDAGEMINVAAHLKNYWLENNPLTASAAPSPPPSTAARSAG